MTRALGLVGAALTAIGLIASMSTRAAAAPAHPVRNGAIAFYAYTRIYAIQPDGSDLRLLVPARRRNCVTKSCNVGDFAWSPDGGQLAFLHRSGVVKPGRRPIFESALYVIDADGRDERRIPGCGRPWPSCLGYSWSPDGSHIVISRFDGLYVLGTRDHSIRQLTSSRTDAAPLWSPDGTSIAFARGRFPTISTYVIPVEGGTATPVPETSRGASCAWSPDSRSLVCQRGERILRIDVGGRRRPTELGHVSGAMTGLSPDGSRLTYVHYRLVHRGDRPPHSTYSTEVWTMTLSGRRRWRVYAGTPDVVGGPVRSVWSPNGARVAFAADAIYVVGAHGSHLRRLSKLGRESISIAGEVAWQPLP